MVVRSTFTIWSRSPQTSQALQVWTSGFELLMPFFFEAVLSLSTGCLACLCRLWDDVSEVFQSHLEIKFMLRHCTMVPGENDITKVFFEDPITIVRSFMWTIFAKLFASQWHRLLMVMVWAATIAGVVLVAIELGGWPYDQVWWDGMGYCTLN